MQRACRAAAHLTLTLALALKPDPTPTPTPNPNPDPKPMPNPNQVELPPNAACVPSELLKPRVEQTQHDMIAVDTGEP